MITESIFDTIDREDKAYWLGFLMADGCVYDNPPRGQMRLSLHLAQKDEDHLCAFRRFLTTEKRVCKCSDGSVKLEVSSDHLCRSLIAHGCTARKSLTLEFPEHLPKKIIRHFVRGYFDGDGSACVSGKRLFMQFVGTMNFLNILKVAIGADSKKVVSRGKIANLQIGSKDGCRHLIRLMYDDAHVWLDRKKKVCQSWLADYIHSA